MIFFPMKKISNFLQLYLKSSAFGQMNLRPNEPLVAVAEGVKPLATALEIWPLVYLWC